MQYKVTVPGRGPGAKFVTPLGAIETHPVHGTATLNDAQRAHLERTYGAKFEPIGAAPPPNDVSANDVHGPTNDAARANIEANAAAAAQAEIQSHTVPVPKTKRKR